MICVATGTKVLMVAASMFTLSWTHSVEKTRWIEWWTAGPDGLSVVRASVEGSGAGMDPPDNARLVDGAYEYELDVPAIDTLVLAASGATGEGWTLCPASSTGPKHGDCLELGDEKQDPIRISRCTPDRPVRDPAAE